VKCCACIVSSIFYGHGDARLSLLLGCVVGWSAELAWLSGGSARGACNQHWQRALLVMANVLMLTTAGPAVLLQRAHFSMMAATTQAVCCRSHLPAMALCAAGCWCAAPAPSPLNCLLWLQLASGIGVQSVVERMYAVQLCLVRARLTVVHIPVALPPWWRRHAIHQWAACASLPLAVRGRQYVFMFLHLAAAWCTAANSAAIVSYI
jgi:hypothetical protein